MSSRQLLTYSCGHTGYSEHAKLCWACYTRQRLRKWETEPGWAIRTSASGPVRHDRLFIYDCGHSGRSPVAKACRACYEHGRFQKSEVEEGFSYHRPDGYRAYRRQRKQLLEHRVIAERVLGRRLKTTEHVHHLNMNRSDNRHRNLVICDIRYHKWLHNEMARRYAQEHGLGRE